MVRAMVGPTPGTEARDRGQQIFLITPQRRASYRVIDIIFDIAELALEGCYKPLDALAHARHIRALQTLALRYLHVDDLTAAGQQVRQHPGRLIGQRTHQGLGRLGKASDYSSIDRVALRTLSQRLGEGSHLRWVHHHQRQPRTRQGGSHHTLVATSRLERHHANHADQAATQLGKAIRIAADCPRFFGRQDVDIQLVLRDINPDYGDLFQGAPSLPKRARFAALTTVRGPRNDGGVTMLRNGLARPRVRRSPLRHRGGYSTPNRPR